MAVKSWYLTVVEKGTNKPVKEINSKLFFTAPDMNKWIKEQEILEKYPATQYYIVKENY
jgi:hypothetical protein